MRTGILATLFLSLCARLAAAEPSINPVIVFDPTIFFDLTISDAQALIRHWQASPYGIVLQGPQCAQLRAQLEAPVQQLSKQMHIDPDVFLGALRNLHVRLSWTALDQVRVLCQIDAGPLARRIMEAVLPLGTPLFVLDADAGLSFTGSTWTVARFGNRLVWSNDGMPAPPMPDPDSPHDLQAHFDPAALAWSPRQQGSPLMPRMVEVYASYFHALEVTADLTATGVHLIGSGLQRISWMKPLAKNWLHLVPATSTLVACLGVDGRAFWDDYLRPICDLEGESRCRPDGEVETEADAHLRGFGIRSRMSDAFGAVQGTIFLSISCPAEDPQITVGIPRSPTLDHDIAELIVAHHDVPPTSPYPAKITMQRGAEPAFFYLRQHYWLVSSDGNLAKETSALDNPSDPAVVENQHWRQSPMGLALGAQISNQVVALSAVDPGAGYTNLAHFLSDLLISACPGEAARLPMVETIGRLAAAGDVSYSLLRLQQGALQMQSDGLGDPGWFLGGLSLAWMGSNCQDLVSTQRFFERARAQAEGMVTDLLRVKILPAQTAYKQAEHGKYGFFSDIAGRPTTSGASEWLPNKIWNAAHPVQFGYRFAIFLSDGQGGALDVEQKPAAQGRAGGVADDFVVYAWPREVGAGLDAFAMDSAGTVYTAPAGAITGSVPVWNALFAGGAWGSKPAWPVLIEHRQSRTPVPKP